MTVKEMWDKYISISGKSINTPYESWHFCNNEADANELAKLTLLGIKRATASLYKSFEAENEPIPKIGDLIVITNWNSEAVCIIEVKKVEILPIVPEVVMANAVDSMSYALGVNMGTDFAKNLESIPGGKSNIELIIKGFTQSMKKDSTLLQPEAAQE